jgi:S1-C subfamily serine protease
MHQDARKNVMGQPPLLSYSLLSFVMPLAAAAAPAVGTPSSPAPSSQVASAVADATFTPNQRAEFLQNVVKVTVTAQSYDFARPWSKRAPVTRRGIGAVIEGGRVLVTAECVANATYIELESADGEQKQSAKVEYVDYESDLALIKPEAAPFLENKPGLGLITPQIGDLLSVLQLEANGNPLFSAGKMTTAEVVRYPIDDSSFLAGRLSVPLQMRDAAFSLPVLKAGKLAGLMLRYDAQSSILDFIPTAVVEHFLKDAAKQPYEGFPRMGCSFSTTRDPQLRRYLKLNGSNGGVLITQVQKDGPASKAGLRKGDVLLEIAGEPIDSDGNYRDAVYGRISLGHLVCTKHFEGDMVPVSISRDGARVEARVPVARRSPEEYLSEPYVIDKAPDFFVLGGLIFQELSRQYLKEFGSDWQRKAPLELLNIDRTQSESDIETRKRVVVLTRVLPSDVTVGYEELRNLVLQRINGEAINRLSDVPTALRKMKDGVHRLEFSGDPSLIFIDASAAEAVGPALQKSYGLPSLSRMKQP